MILREATIKYKGYDPEDLKPKSNKRICYSYNSCGRIRWLPKQDYHSKQKPKKKFCSNECRGKWTYASIYSSQFSATLQQVADTFMEQTGLNIALEDGLAAFQRFADVMGKQGFLVALLGLISEFKNWSWAKWLAFQEDPSKILTPIKAIWDAIKTLAISIYLIKEQNPAWKGGDITLICEVCGIKFKVLQSQRNQKFCSYKCMRKDELGKPLSEKHKETLRKSLIKHHYIYDHNDLSKYTILTTRKQHRLIHKCLRKMNIKIPHINMGDNYD